MRDLRSHHRLLVKRLGVLPWLTVGLGFLPAAAQMSRPASLVAPPPSTAEASAPIESGAEEGTSDWSKPLPDLEDLAGFLNATGWDAIGTPLSGRTGLAEVQVRSFERIRPINRNIGLQPLLDLAVIDYPDRTDVPGGNGNQFQRWSADDAMTWLAPFLVDVGAANPASLRAVRRGPRIYVVATNGHVFAPIVGSVFEDVRTIVSANPGSERHRLVVAETANRRQHARIAEAQELLFDLGFYGGDLDGSWGSMSRAGMKAFQDISGLPITGEADPASLAALRRRHEEILGP